MAERAAILADEITQADASRPGPHRAAGFAIALRAINRRDE